MASIQIDRGRQSPVANNEGISKRTLHSFIPAYNNYQTVPE